MSRFSQALAATTLSTLSLLAVVAVDAPAHAAPAATYVVKSGDYLTGIALKVGAKIDDLLSVNHLKITSVIHPGDTLVLPAGAASVTANSPAPAAPASTVYVVQSGDSIASIAHSHGVKIFALLTANKMTLTSVIHPGAKLTVPPATMPIPVPPAPAKPATPIQSAATVVASEAPVAQSKSITTLLAYLQAQVGKPYQFNAEGPDAFDCSGLVTAAFNKIGISLPHQSLLQSTYGVAVDWKTQPIKAGDLVFMYSSANPTVISHVGIAIDSKNWIQAARTGTPVRIGPLPSSVKIQSVRRIVQG
jgi:cell wall-associated NlpC family hydrolase